MSKVPFSAFEDRVVKSKDRLVPAATLLTMWVAASDGSTDPSEKKVVGDRVNGSSLPFFSRLALDGNRRALQLACELAREAPREQRLGILFTAVRVAAADGKLTLEENYVLRFLADALGESPGLPGLFELETGQALPDALTSEELREHDDPLVSLDRARKALTLIGRLRLELDLPASDWWDDGMILSFGQTVKKGLEKPKLAKAEKLRVLQKKLLKAAACIGVLLILIFVIISRTPSLQFNLAQKRDTIPAYERFMERFPDSGMVSEARERVRVLREDEVWHDSEMGRSLAGYRTYLEQYPEGVHRASAEAQVTRLLKIEGGKLVERRDMKGLEKLSGDYAPGGEPAQFAEPIAEAVERLRDDGQWVVAEGSREDCWRFLNLKENDPQFEPVNSRLVDLLLESGSIDDLWDYLNRHFKAGRRHEIHSKLAGNLLAEGSLEDREHFILQYPDAPHSEAIENLVIVHLLESGNMENKLAFLKRHSKSKRWSEMDRHVVEQVLASTSPADCWNYLDNHKGGQDRMQVEEHLVSLLLDSGSLEDCEEFMRRFPSSPRAGEVEALAVEHLLGSGTIADCKNFLRRHPTTEHRAEIEKQIIDLEVEEIAREDHGKLPDPERIGRGDREGNTSLLVTNATGHELTVRYSGVESYRFVIKPQGLQTLRIKAGSYTVAASVNSPGVRNFVGKQTLRSGLYKSKYIITTTPGGIFPRLPRIR